MRNELDRENLQKELDHICSEIDRICKSAKFNTVELFQDVVWRGSAPIPRAPASGNCWRPPRPTQRGKRRTCLRRRAVQSKLSRSNTLNTMP